MSFYKIGIRGSASLKGPEIWYYIITEIFGDKYIKYSEGDFESGIKWYRTSLASDVQMALHYKGTGEAYKEPFYEDGVMLTDSCRVFVSTDTAIDLDKLRDHLLGLDKKSTIWTEGL